MRDDIQFNIDFCIEVQQYANLYDYGRSDYCLLNRSLQDQTWKKIARKFKANTADCKERWKNIRGSYSKYMAKLKKPDHAAKRVKEYYLAPYLFFLDPFLKTRKSKGNAIDKSVDESIVKNEAELSDYEDNYPNCESVVPDDCLSVRSSQSSARPTSNSKDIEPSEIIALERPKPKQYYGSKRKYSSTNNANKRVYQYDKKRKESLKIQIPAKAIHPPDPDLAFLHSVLPDMKSMNGSQKRNFKMGVLDLAEKILSSTFNTNQARATSPNKLETNNP